MKALIAVPKKEVEEKATEIRHERSKQRLSKKKA